MSRLHLIKYDKSVLKRSTLYINEIASFRFTTFAITIVMLLGVINISAQNQKQLVKTGDKLIAEYGDFYGASIWYKQALDLDSTYLDIAFKYAEALRGYNDYAKAEAKYYYIFRKDRGRNFPMAPYWHATMQKYNGKYSDAKKSFKRAKRYFSRDRKGYYYLKIMNEIKSCEAAIEIR